MKKQQVEYYDSIPEVPQDFDGAVVVHALALKAIYYWQEERKYALFSDQQHEASTWLNKWKDCKEQAQTVIQSYQLRLFK